jgi:2-polyprenyl-3-methyl-5-hydroxy-6-metoxy-1,4-benzoquinol methylase
MDMMGEMAKPKETSFEYGKSHQEVMVGYYHESKVISPTNNEYLRVRLAVDLVNEHAVGRFGKPKDELILVDVACSVGIVTLALAKDGFNPIGVDFDPAALEIAERLNAEEGTNAKFLRMDVSDWDLEVPIDIAVCFDVFEHLHDDELGSMLTGLKRKLSPRGCIVFHTLPLKYDYLFWQEGQGIIAFPKLLRPFRKWHERRFTKLVQMYAMCRDLYSLAHSGGKTHKEMIKMDGHCNPLTQPRLEDIFARAGYELPFIKSGFLSDVQLDPRDRPDFHSQPVTHRSLYGIAVPKRRN